MTALLPLPSDTEATEPSRQDDPGKHKPARSRKRSRVARRWARPLTQWSLRRALVILIGMAGVSILLYPSAGAWFSDRQHADTVSGYVKTVDSLEPATTKAEIAAARVYNRNLPHGAIKDPYGSTGTSRETALGADARKYLKMLDVQGDGIMGVLAISSVDVSLPIYHGTGAHALERGVGHLYGSALPVGGRGTHAVLTGHSGIAGITLFSNLHDVQLGATFTVTVLDKTFFYRVDQIKTVLPENTDDLQAVPGRDYVTLITCTPTGINTHRLLVRGVRIPTPKDTTDPAFLHGGGGPGFPWWALQAGGALVLVLLLTTPLGVKRT